MKQLKIVTLLAVVAMLFASCGTHVKSTNPQPKGISKTEVDSVSYAIGYSLGMSIKMGNFGDLSMAKINKGMKDALEGLELQPQDVNSVITDFVEKRNMALSQVNIAKSEKFLADNAKKDSIQTTASGLQYKIVRPGDGMKPFAKDSVEVNYEGSTIDGKIFDSSYERGESVTFGLSQVIKGWTEGIQLIGEGGEIMLYIPAELGYGERGAGDVIAPNEALIFKVELIKVIPSLGIEEVK